MILFLADEL